MLSQSKPKEHWPVLVLHLAVLTAAGLLVALISIDTFRSRSFVHSERLLTLQFWTCIFFMADIVAEFIYSPDRRRYARTHWAAVLLCVPYVGILRYLGIDIHAEWQFVIVLIPVVRAVAVLSAVLVECRFGRFDSMFSAYVVLLASILYFCSLMFFVAESGHNPGVHSFRSALYWAVMSMTTTGSQITETTAVGEALAAVLSGTGLMLFPVFTVYISNAVARPGKKDAADAAGSQS